MNSSGRFSLMLVSVLTLVMAGLFVGATTAGADDRSDTAQSFYTSFGRYIDPDEFGGPYIIAATWDPDGDGGDGELRVVFSEPIDAATVEDPDAGDDNYDFLPFGWGWFDGEMPTQVEVLDIPSAGDQRVVALRGFSESNPPAVGDSIALSSIDNFGDDWTDGVADPEGTVAQVHTRVPITTGPVAVSVSLSNDWFTVPMSDAAFEAMDIIIEFDHDIVVPNNAVENIFDLTPELSDATGGIATDPIDFSYAAGVEDNELVVTWNADAHFRYLRPGWSKLWIREGLIEWDTATGALNVRQNTMLDNEGPNLLGATYIAASDEIWLTFDEPMDPAYLPAALAANPQYTVANGAAFGGAETQELGFPQGFPHTVVITDAAFTWSAITNTIQVDHSLAGPDIVDHQFVTGPDETVSDEVPIYDGIMILRASYDEGGAGVADDVLRILFSETINNPGAIDAADFAFLPGEFNSLWDDPDLTLSHSTTGAGFAKVEVTGWDLVDELDGGPLPKGLMVKLDAADNNIVGFLTALGTANTAAAVPVLQDIVDWPGAELAEEVTSMIRKYYNPGPPVIDEAYLAWTEPGPDDLVDSWLLFTAPTEAQLTQSLIDDWKDEALPVSNLRSQMHDSGVQIVAVDISEGTSYTNTTLPAMADGDEVWFMLVPTVYTGSIGPKETALQFSAPITVGPPCPPIDFSATIPDDDMIHVRAVLDEALEEWTYIIWGDLGSAPCGDSVFVSDDPVLHGDANRLGAGLIAGNRSFGPITLTMPDPVPSEIYVFSRLADQDVWSATSEDILVDTVEPTVNLWNNPAGQDVIQYADRFNPLQIYTEGDYINILLQAYDGVDGVATALSDLLVITADFSQVNAGASVTGVPDVTAVPFVSLGADRIDNDGDWVAEDPAIDRNMDGVMDFPEPYFDEDGDGLYTPGETFLDLNANGWCDAPRGDGLGNPVPDPPGVVYDLNLDSADPDEHGFYEIQLTADFNDLTKGFPLEDAVTDPTMGFGELFDLEVWVTVADTTMDLTTAYDGVDEDPAFYCEVDEVAPTVSKITELQVTGGLGIDPATVDNLIVPTDPTYNLGRFVSFQAETPSDDDVLFGVTQIYANRTGGFAWETLTLDPSGENADEGFPGVAGFDDDGDVAAFNLQGNGIDDDEDGVIDNPEEGIDHHDPEVVDAAQDSVANAAAGVDLIWRQTDRRDNDNDAFFVFEPYYDGGANVYQRVIFYNIDESTTNDADDDGDGEVDEADEVETYDANLDDNEDGIIDGEAVELTADATYIVTAFDDTYADVFYVDAAHVLGAHPADADGDIRAMTEFIEPGYGVLNEDLFPWNPNFPGMDWGPGADVNNELDWYASHGNENIDFEHIAKLYGMTADGSTEYQLRVLAYDQPGLVNAANSYPITFTLDVTWPEDLTITNCADGDPETGPADFEDVLPGDGLLQVYDDMAYTLTVENDDDAAEVLFQYRTSEDEGSTWGPGGGTFGAADGWADLAGGWDDSRPFTDEYTAPALDNDPPDNSLMVEFRAVPKDEFGNAPDLDAAVDPDSVCVFPVTVIDGTPPLTAFTLIHEVENATGPVPPDPAGPWDPYWYRDTHGPVQVPAGPVIDVWAWFDDQDGDPATNDVARMVFEYREVGADPDADWTHFATVTGSVVVDPVTGDTLAVDLTYPVAVTLDTETLGTGSYDIRVYGCDIEGNCNVTTADIATIVVTEEGLRAYIQDPYASAPATLELYAFNYLHDTVIDYVTFQYAAAAEAPDYNWIDVGIDGSASQRGDVLFHIGTQTAYYDLEDLPLGDQHQEFNADELFWDADEDGYSERDPIIRDGGLGGVPNGTFEIAEDEIILGGTGPGTVPPEGATLTAFPATFFHTDDIDDDEFTGAGEWIFEHNAEEGDNAELDLWHVQWDVSGLNGEFVARAVATDIYSATDEGDIPMVDVTIDSEPPYASISMLTLPDGTTLDPETVPSLYVEGSHGWFMLEASTDAADIDYIEFQYSTNGGATWTDLDINDDNDFYADINDMPGFQKMDAPGVPYGDEVFLDDGDFVFSEGDIVLYDGGNGVVDTPLGTALIPLTTEDPTADGVDDDGDGLDGEDPDQPEDYDAPYLVYFYIDDLPFASDGDVFFRAVAHDESGNSDPDNTEEISVLVGESEPPVSDLIWAKTPDGTELDVWQTISDGTGVDMIGSNPEDLTLSVFVTAEDNGISGPLSIDLMWRMNPDCYPDLEPWENPWMSMADGGFTTIDATPPEYTFTVDMAALIAEYGDAAIVFFPQAADQGGNVTPAPVNPYALRLMTNEAAITTALPATVSPGDEFWFEAELTTPVEGATVAFYYAPRILDVEINATLVSQATPYVSPALDEDIAADPGCHVTLYIDGEPGTYHEDLDAVESPTKLDYTVNGTNVIRFGAPVATDDVILVSYNLDDYALIGLGDSMPPYTVAWDAGDGGVPEPPAPLADVTEAYDIIAVASIGSVSSGECSLVEAQCSEGAMLYLVGDEAPDMALWMMGGNNAAPGDFWPGNPSFDSVANLTEWKMSGIEHQVFATHEDGGTPVEVDLILTDEAGDETVVPMSLYAPTATTVPMTFTMYEADYAQSDLLYPAENVWLTLAGVNYEMTELEAGIWQVTDVPVPVGATTEYNFYVDMVGDDFGELLDARNQRDDGGMVSDIKVPAPPFWFADLGNEAPVPAASAYFGTETAVWQLRLMATDAEENVGYTAPVLMVYDPESPSVDEITLESLRFSDGAVPPPESWVQAFDPVPGDFNIITVDQVIWEYCPNYAADEADRVWIYLGEDADPDGGWHLAIDIPDPETDGYDNDGDGEWDEIDESTSAMALRAWARDDGYNTGGPAMIEFTLDSTDPAAEVTAPANGDVFPFSGGPFDVTAEITDSEEDIAYVQFQYSVAGGVWNDIDITPEWDGDDPWDAEPPYAVTFDPINYLDEHDSYVRIRAMAVDTAGNEDADAPEILIAINDITGPSAMPMWAASEGVAFAPLADPNTAITGDSEIRVTVFDPTQAGNIHRCDLEYYDETAAEWLPVGSEEVDFVGTSTTVDFPWNVDGVAEGTYDLRAWCYDIDMNALDGDPVVVAVRIDHTGPAVVYEAMGADFAGFVNSASFENDGVVGESSLVIMPDPVTGDVTFLVATPDGDCQAVLLQFQEQPNDSPGEWDLFGTFDYEPNLNFTYEDTYYHVWRLLQDDWVDVVGPGGLDLAGHYHWRALAIDYAGNANGTWDDNNPWGAYHVDPTDPEGVSLTNSLQANQVASGEDVTFYFEGTDALTDVASVRFEYMILGSGQWIVIDPDPATPEIETVPLTSANIDTDFPRWYAEVTWTTLYPLVEDTVVNIRAVFYDTAGNEGDYELDEGPITVEDNIAPDATKLVYLASDIRYVEDAGGTPGYLGDCENDDHDGLYIEIGGGSTTYDAGTDIPIDFGDGGGVLTGGAPGVAWGTGANLWPRFVDENVIEGDHPIIFSGATFLVARTQGADTGIERVEFWVEDGAGELMLVGVDECAPEYDEFGASGGLWQCIWDSEDVDNAGDPLYPDGDYTIYLRAVDLEGNIEEVDADGSRLVTVDNTAPMGTPDADALTEEVETSYGEIERNGTLQLFARSDTEVADDTITFYYKRTRDLNTGEEWEMVDSDWGVDDNDMNPDDTRPYVFDWDLNKMDVPLIVGESYDVAVATTDIVGNGETHIDAFDDGRLVTFTVTDTQAPCATITEIARETGDTDPIVWPHLYDMIYARDLDYVEASVLDYAPDAIRVEFMYAPEGGTTPTLIDADLDEVAPYTWRISNWDLSALNPGVTYDVFAVAYDDIGNYDFDEETGRPTCGPAFKLVFDNTPPSFEADLSHLTECPQEGFGFTTYPACWQHGEDEVPDEHTGPSLPECGRVAPYGFAGAAEGAVYEIDMMSNGNVGVATFRYRVDGDDWSGTMTTGANVLLEDGVYVAFTDGNSAPSFTDDMSFEFDTLGDVYDLVFTSTDTDIDRDRIFWEYKLSAEPDGDEYWTFDRMNPIVLYDGQTQRYSTTWETNGLSGVYDLRLTVYDMAGNRHTMVMAEGVVIDSENPEIDITNIVIHDPAGGEDTVIDPADFGTVIDVTPGDVLELWVTANDDDELLPEHLETGVSRVIFEVFNAGDTAWRELGMWQAPDPTDVPLEVVASQQWNTSGLMEGDYLLRAWAEDERCNLTVSGTVMVSVVDHVPPRARIAAFDPWQEDHGDDLTTYCDIYAIAYSDASISQVQFQYLEGDEWIPIGIASDYEPDCGDEPDEGRGDLWYTTIDLGMFDVGQTITFRAIASDEVPNQDPNPPTIDATIAQYADGSLNLEPTGGEVVANMEMVMVGGDSPTEVIVTVEMADEIQHPHVMFTKPVPASLGGGACWIEMTRRIDNGTMWSGTMDIDESDCGKFEVFANGLTTANTIDMAMGHVWTWEVTNELGSNGVAMVPGYMNMDTEEETDYLYATGMIPSGTGDDWDSCFTLFPSPAPMMNVDQERFLTLVDRTCYYVGMPDDINEDIGPGYWPVLTIDYDEVALEAALGDEWDVKEPYLTVRVWDAEDGEWQGQNISHVAVDTDANQVSFTVQEVDDSYPFYAIFAPAAEAPVVVESFTPSSVKYGRWDWTDVDPVITAMLYAGGVEHIDPATIELWIDGQLYASVLDWTASDDYDTWTRGNGILEVNQANPDGTIWEVIYRHSFRQEDWLREADNPHSLNILYKHEDGLNEWIELLDDAPGAVFYVDETAPLIEFHGGWVGNPLLANVSGYLNPAQSNDMLTVKLFDNGSGIYVRPDHPEWVWDCDCTDDIDPTPWDAQHPGVECDTPGEDYGCWVEVDWSIKYDLWLVEHESWDGIDYEDDQSDIDEIEERVLLHSGTADELIPYMTPPLYSLDPDVETYTPDDTLYVRLPVVGGGLITDGDILEVTLYTSKHVDQSHGGDDWYEHTGIDTVWVDDHFIYIYNEWYDTHSQELHVYDGGVLDYTWNMGSQYVEQRFIVDMSAPEVTLLSPTGGHAAPGESFTFQVAVEDGAGLGEVSAVLKGPGGEEIEIDDLTIENGVITGRVDDGLALGNYTIEVSVADRVGNTAVVRIPVTTESRTLALTETYIYPNPYNPSEGNATLHLNLSKTADLSFKVYDFAGEYVATLDPMTGASGPVNVAWAGQASDGTPLANGAYMIRVMADDGTAKKSAVIKAVIWRE